MAGAACSSSGGGGPPKVVAVVVVLVVVAVEAALGEVPKAAASLAPLEPPWSASEPSGSG